MLNIGEGLLDRQIRWIRYNVIVDVSKNIRTERLRGPFYQDSGFPSISNAIHTRAKVLRQNQKRSFVLVTFQLLGERSVKIADLI